MNRIKFIKYLTGSILIGIPLIAIACTSSDEDAINGPSGNNGNKDCLSNGTNSSITSNHGHSLVVSKSDISAGVEKQYDIKGSSGHGHSITVSANNFATLKNNQQIQIASSNEDSHSHSVTISCA